MMNRHLAGHKWGESHDNVLTCLARMRNLCKHHARPDLHEGGVVLQALRQGLEQVLARITSFYPVDVLIRSGREFSDDRGSIYAAAMSYYVFFSLFPTMIFLVTVFGWIVRDPQIQARVVDLVVAEIPQGFDVRNQVEAVIDNVAETSRGVLGLVGIIGTAWSASVVFGALRQVLNAAFDVPTSRSYLSGRLFDMLNLVGLTILVLFSVAATAAFQIVRRLTTDVVDGAVVTVAWNLATYLLPLFISFYVFVLVYRIIPNYRASFRDVWIGALIASVGFEAAKVGFTIYVANFGNYQEVYGALGGVVAFLFFVFLVSNIVIFAAEVVSELSKDRILRETHARPIRPDRRAHVIDKTPAGG